jgi:succinate-semialdehyde dehydrogenase/glutarate-semialdehyde dehydrogenase
MISPRVSSIAPLTVAQLKDPSLLKQDVCYVNGEWVKAKSGKTFKVNGKLQSPSLVPYL